MQRISILLFIFLVGCSTAPQFTNPLIARSPAAKQASCHDIMSLYLEKSPSYPKHIQEVRARRKAFKNVATKLGPKLENINFAPLTRFDTEVKTLQDPTTALAAKIQLIRNARQSIDLTSFILGSDSTSYLIMQELKKALERGVEIRIVLDSMGTSIESGSIFQQRLKALQNTPGGFIKNQNGVPTGERAEISIALFNEVTSIHHHVKNWFKRMQNLFRAANNQHPLTNFHLNRRMHDKILLVDATDPERSYAVLGGRNLADQYYGRGTPAENFEDFEVLMKAPGNEEGFSPVLQAYVDRLYFHLGNKYLEDTFFKNSSRTHAQEIKKMRKAQDHLPDIEEKIEELENQNFLNAGFTNSSAKLLHELDNIVGSTPKRKVFQQNSIIKNFRQEIKEAKHKINIISPYLQLDAKDIEIFKNWLDEDPSRQLRIITSSAASNDQLLVQGVIDKILIPRLLKKLNLYVDEGRLEILAFGNLEEAKVSTQKQSRLRTFFFGKKSSIEHTRLHTKLITIDDHSSYVTSFNYNGRSRFLDSESGVILTRKGEDSISNDVNDYIEDLASRSYVWGSPEWKTLQQRSLSRPTEKFFNFLTRLITTFKLESSL